MKPWILLVACCLSAAAWAGDACDQAQSDFDRFSCLHKANQAAEQALNASYQELISLLDADGRARLRSHQLAWIRTRNAQCSQRKGTSQLIDPRCMTEVTQARTRFLQERIGECKGAGCLNDKL
ncbi:MAG TPA: lysozyme inhibitor LprI family protein [Ottowia sp.]|uniref:lysozyme inhibitor LprI family protein n=1 Tax=Ottowia sp. TaxID=1898956 RepID=UPI002C90B97D|nr:lysozyme inhibitor LprI family protein [Ottowia sp.]HMN22762.1 lysozyme inhibitor LprI family protein [Ottowia sp.]